MYSTEQSVSTDFYNVLHQNDRILFTYQIIVTWNGELRRSRGHRESGSVR